MNPLREWRRLRAVPDEPEPEKHEAVHSNGMPGPSLAVVRADVAAQNLRNNRTLDDENRERAEMPRVSARPGDPTPIFDEVMNAKWWPATGGLSDDGLGRHHALATQFEVSFILGEFSDEDRAEIAREAAEDVEFGWTP